MNKWARKTVRLVNRGNYLDRLLELYPNQPTAREPLSSEARVALRRTFNSGNDEQLLNVLLNMKKFPFKDSYIAFLRKCRPAIRKNPITVARICTRLRKMGFNRVIKGLQQPKEANTQRGNQFLAWTRKNFRWVKEQEFMQSEREIVMLQASATKARDFCNREMGVGISKRPDIVAKAGRRYVVGEAKFLSATGGNQGRGFDDGMSLAANTTGNAFKVFILDGVHWVETGSDQYKRIEAGNSAVFSALLLKDFLEELAKGK